MTDPATPPTLPVDYETAIIATAERLAVQFASSQQVRVPSARLQEGSRIAWEAIHGHLRGRIPFPVPPDLMGVAVSAGLRITKGFAYTGSASLDRGRINEVADERPWSGFMMTERVTLSRYRQRTA